jgi:cytochrome c peroxidase
MKTAHLLKRPVLCSVALLTLCSASFFHDWVFAGEHSEAALLGQAQQNFKPLPEDMGTPEFPTTPERVALGRALFFDPRLSLDGTVSCSRCHLPSLYGTDALPRAIGVENRLNPRNAPTILNAALQFADHWYGDRSSVEEQAAKSFLGNSSFGNPDFASVIAKIKAVPSYENMFAKAFPGEKHPTTQENTAKAIGAYERTLVTPSAFDAYLKGDAKALSPEAKAGLTEFIGTGCASCHNGVGIGGGMFQKFGSIDDYWKATKSKEVDKGRSSVTNNSADQYVFKVPMLRNVAMTPPYFHDGSVATVPEAVRIMAKVQLGKEINGANIKMIIVFLESLTGSLPENFATPPTLPPAGFRERE